MNIYIETASYMALGGGFVYLLTKTYFVEKIKLSIKNDYDTVIENIRGEIGKNHAVLTSVLSSQSQSFQAGQEERLVAIKELWSNYLIIRDSLIEIRGIDTVLEEHEFNELFTPQRKGNDFFEKQLRQIPVKHLKNLETVVRKIELIRPFINEKIWLNINFLNRFSGRIIFLYMKGARKNEISHWKSDNSLLKLVKEALDENEFQFLMNSKSNTVSAFQSFMEQKILADIHGIITGEIAADNTYNRALKLADLLKPDN